jgi:hypothetical protein
LLTLLDRMRYALSNARTRIVALVSTGAIFALALSAAPRLARTPTPEMLTPAVLLAEEPAEVVVSVARSGRHLGFDTNIYPGDRAMRAWINEGSPYEWVGFYLEAPCHRDDSWTGKRETLTQMGWGTAVIYVGQQIWPKNRGRARAGSNCSTSFVSAARGRRDGADAIRRTEREGFPRGSVIFLDIEHMEVVPKVMRDYYRAWTKTVLADGRYRPGYYVHERNAATVHADITATLTELGEPFEPPFWLAGNSRRFSLAKTPTAVGHDFAAVWQGLLDVVRTHNGVRLPIDVNVAAVPSPSSHEYYGVAAQ